MVAAFGVLEWTFIIAVGALLALAGVFGLYVVIQLFRNPSRRRSP